MPTTRPPPREPIALTASSSVSRPRAMIATSAPEPANLLAIANPIPLLAPVITADRPARLMSIACSRYRLELSRSTPSYSPDAHRGRRRAEDGRHARLTYNAWASHQARA